MKNLIDDLESYVENPKIGLQEELFYFVGRLTPFVNVDLLVRDTTGNVVFTWRNDEHSGTGWHLPGGIIRFQETFIERIKHVATNEIGITLDRIDGPCAINQIIDISARERSHFISLLFECPLDNENSLLLQKINKDNKNMLLSSEVPNNLLKKHQIYIENIMKKQK
jgi:ADP-ribose pyrophosphatase YjhB (NUDIX family)